MVVAVKNEPSITGSVIQLGVDEEAEGLKEQNHIIYESKQELIKKYAIYGFALFCVVLSALLIFEKLN